MKKFIILLASFIFLVNLPCAVFGENWIQYDEKKYFDTETIKNDPLDKNKYSLLTKILNDNSENIKLMEMFLDSKILYTLGEAVIDCDKKEIFVENILFHGNQNNLLFTGEVNKTFPITSGSSGENLYNYVCLPKTENYDTLKTE